MKKLIWLLLLFPVLSASAQKGDFSIKDLVLLTNVPENKFSSYISRKGFKPFLDDSVQREFSIAYQKISKDKSIEKLLGRYDKNDTATIFYQTNSKLEFEELQT